MHVCTSYWLLLIRFQYIYIVNVRSNVYTKRTVLGAQSTVVVMPSVNNTINA